eukprot:3116617-Rhodomonas_salina.2
MALPLHVGLHPRAPHRHLRPPQSHCLPPLTSLEATRTSLSVAARLSPLASAHWSSRRSHLSRQRMPGSLQVFLTHPSPRS